VDLYVTGQLSGDPLEEFELDLLDLLDLLDNTELQDAVLVARQVRDGLTFGDRSLPQSHEPAANVVPMQTPTGAETSEPIQSRQTPDERRHPATVTRRWAVAASLALTVSVLAHFIPESDSGMTHVDRIVYLDQTRSSEPPRSSIPAMNAVLLSISVSGEPHQTHVVTTRRANEVVLTDANARAGSDLPASINVVLPPLAAGTYLLQVDDDARFVLDAE